MQFLSKILNIFSPVPLSIWLIGALAAAMLEHFLGDAISYYLYLPKIPVLSGADIIIESSGAAGRS